MCALFYFLSVLSIVLSDHGLHKYRVSDEMPSRQDLLYVTNDDLSSKFKVISKHLSTGSAVLFEKCNPRSLRPILSDAKFPVSPDETIQFMMLHWYINEKGYKIYHIKEYDHYKLSQGAMRNSAGAVKLYNNVSGTVHSIKRSVLFDQYIADILDYTEQCVIKHECSQHINIWYKNNGFNDQNGMQPTNASAVWGKIETTLYYAGHDSFNSLLPYNTYMYANANPSTLQLENIVIYMIAEGLHAQNQSDPTYCNVDGCRGIFHREMLIDLNARPANAYTQQNYHWIFSTPATANGVTQVTTSFSQTQSQGLTAHISAEGASMTFQSAKSTTYAYQQAEAVNDFTCDELTNGADTVGSWHYFQSAPVSIATYPLTNFANDWQQWYSSNNNPCKIVSGPNLASASMQTSNAIKWEADPLLVDFKSATFNVSYYVSVKVEQDHIWCQDWTGKPANPCNTNGEKHHCEDDIYSGIGPLHSANIIQAMNNINTTSA